MIELVWREPFRVRFYEADAAGRATLPSLCRYMQAAADAHCRPHGYSLDGLLAQGRTWVLTRFALRLAGSPRIGEDVVIETWGTGRLGGIRAYRDFRLLGADGSTLGEASTLWFLLDAGTRRPLKLPDAVLAFRNADRPDPLVELAPLEAPERVCGEKRVQVLARDLDANGHANTASYVEWALETAPAEVLRHRRPVALDAHFISEALPGEEVVCEWEDGGSRFRHNLRAGDGRRLALLQTEWAD